MSFANSFSSFPPPGTAQAPRLVDTPPRPVPRAPEATVPAVPSPIGAADQLRDQQDVRDLEIVNQRLLDAIASGDKLTYSVLVDDGVTALAPVRDRFPDFADLLASEPEADLFASLRAAESVGRPLGDERFLSRLERKTGRVLKPGKRGPKPSAEDED